MRRGRRTDHDLTRFADGRVWRLKRDRDFAGSPRAFRQSARTLAADMGKVVSVIPDKLRPDRFVWVQFGDHSVSAGEPCVCGSTKLVRLHRHWARCADCGRLLDVVPAEPEVRTDDDASLAVTEAEDVAPSQGKRVKVTRLDELRDVRLFRHSFTSGVERCYGFGLRPEGTRVLISVSFPLEDGSRIPDDEVPDEWRHRFTFVPLDAYEALLEGTDLEDGVPVSWKMELDSGPRHHEDFEEPAPG